MARSAYFVLSGKIIGLFWRDTREMYPPTAFFQLGAYKIRVYCQNRLSERTCQRNLARKSPSSYAGVQNNHFLPHFARNLGRGAANLRANAPPEPLQSSLPASFASFSHSLLIPFASLSDAINNIVVWHFFLDTKQHWHVFGRLSV